MSYNVDIDCPYDRTPCEKKQEQVRQFREYMMRMSINKTNHTFVETHDDKCPDNPNKCIRYQRYLNIIEQYKINNNQH